MFRGKRRGVEREFAAFAAESGHRKMAAPSVVRTCRHKGQTMAVTSIRASRFPHASVWVALSHACHLLLVRISRRTGRKKVVGAIEDAVVSGEDGANSILVAMTSWSCSTRR
jgi:hypothetical protein